MTHAIKLAIENLYEVFNRYKINDFAHVTCFDYGPTAEELATISGDLRHIPINILDRMEFYADNWDSWGTENEVKYFLPRLLECMYWDIELLTSPSYFSLFKYKLKNCFSSNEKWSEKEKNCIKFFFDNVLELHFSKSIEIEFLIECTLALDMSPASIMRKWKNQEALYKSQIKRVLEHFYYTDYTKSCSSKGVYLDNNERILKFLDYLLSKLTAEEIAEISFLGVYID